MVAEVAVMSMLGTVLEESVAGYGGRGGRSGHGRWWAQRVCYMADTLGTASMVRDW